MSNHVLINNDNPKPNINWYTILRYDYFSTNLLVAFIIFIVLSIFGFLFNLAIIPGSHYRPGKIETDVSLAFLLNSIMLYSSITCFVLLIIRLLRFSGLHKSGVIINAEIVPFNNDGNWVKIKYCYNDVKYQKYCRFTTLKIMDDYSLGKNYDVFRKLIIEYILIVVDSKHPKRCTPIRLLYGLYEIAG